MHLKSIVMKLITGADVSGVTNKFNLITEIFVAGVRVIGIITVVKGLQELSSAWPQRDSSGIAQGVSMIIGGLVAVMAREILGWFGISI